MGLWNKSVAQVEATRASKNRADPMARPAVCRNLAGINCGGGFLRQAQDFRLRFSSSSPPMLSSASVAGSGTSRSGKSIVSVNWLSESVSQ